MLHFTDEQFKKLFRLNKQLVRYLLERLRPVWPVRGNTRGVTLEVAIFSALRFYATGSYQTSVGQVFTSGMAQSAFHKYLHEVTNLLLETILPEEVVFSKNEAERFQNKREFYRRWGYPGVIGAIDCTHVAI